MAERSLPQIQTLARSLIDRETSGETAEARLLGADRALSALAAQIRPLVGGDGFQMLLHRALMVARRDHHWLALVRADLDSAQWLSGVTDSDIGASPQEVTAAAQAIMTELIGLLARFVGADMTIRLIRQSFPEGSRK